MMATLTKKDMELLHALATQYKHDCEHAWEEVKNNEILGPVLAEHRCIAADLEIKLDRILCGMLNDEG